MNHNPLVDVDIPIAIASIVVDQDQHHQHQQQHQHQQAQKQDDHDQRPTLLEKGRSSRIVISADAATSMESALDEFEIQALRAQGYPAGLIQSICRNRQAFPYRIWVVDNSGSMSSGDGHRIVETGSAKTVKLVRCSRWTELQQTVDYHAQMAGLLKAPTVFRLLNDPGRMAGPQQFSIAERGAELIPQDLQLASQTMRQATPSGVTPLAEHVQEIRENLLAMLPQLAQTGQKVAIILATDGLPTDSYGVSSSATRSQFEMALRSLEGLPVWIVIRLCTDEDSVVEYYNNLDNQLELSLEVLDDFVGEAKEVYQQNPWLTYSLCLHRTREMGFHHRLFDLLDERLLTVDELKEFFQLIFGSEMLDGMVDPQVDFKRFCDHIGIYVHREAKQWDPVTKKMAYIVDMKKLKRAYADSSCCIM